MISRIIDQELQVARLADANILASIHQECFKKSWGTNSFAALISCNLNLCWLVTKSLPIGFIVVRVIHKEAEILTLAVREKYRRNGVASALVKHSFYEIKKLHVNVCYLEGEENNTGAKQLYQKEGFSQIGVRKKYYRYDNDHSEDAKVMSLNI